MLTPLQKVLEWTIDHVDPDGSLPEEEYAGLVSVILKHKPPLIIVESKELEGMICLDERDNGEESRAPEECFIIDVFPSANQAIDECHKRFYVPYEVVSIETETEELDLASAP